MWKLYTKKCSEMVKGPILKGQNYRLFSAYNFTSYLLYESTFEVGF